MTDSLLFRLQSLTEPSREIDAEIAEAVHPWLRDCPRADGDDGPGWLTKDGRVYAPRYTESLDMALTLRPEGYDLLLADFAGHRPSATLQIKGGGYHAAPEICFEADGASLAIATLIAIMKAKEESAPPSEDKP